MAEQTDMYASAIGDDLIDEFRSGDEGDDHKSFLDIIAIVKLIFEEVIPKITDCIEPDNNNSIGKCICDDATECEGRSLRGKLRKLYFKRLLRRATDREEREALGGINAIANSFIRNAIKLGPDSMDQVINDHQ